MLDFESIIVYTLYINKNKKEWRLQNMIIYNLKLANFLLNRGHTINGIKQNRNNSYLLVFHFNMDDTLQADINDFHKKKEFPKR